MSNFSNALAEIIERSFDGKAASLAQASSNSPSTLSRLLTGKFEPKIENLEALADSLNRTDRKQLLLAAARDRVPSKFQSELFGDEDPASQILRARLSPDLAAVIRYLESSAMNDEATAAYLRRIGSWTGITQPEIQPLSIVAEDPQRYSSKKNGTEGNSSASTNA